jgi:GNAT superfamily N-acetyltransferase
MPITTPDLPQGYELHTGFPSVAEYRHLRYASGLTPMTEAQSAAVPAGTWYGCYIAFTTPAESNTSPATAVAMGRIVGDGAWYFQIADMAVLPEHQRRGLGGVILKELLAQVRERAPEGDPYVTLMADAPGRRLYAKNGFVEAAPKEMGMLLPGGWRER